MITPLTFNKGELYMEDGTVWKTDELCKDKGQGGTHLTSWIEIEINGTVLQLPIKIYYDHQPYEARTFDYPGCPEAVTVESVEVVGLKTDELEEFLVDNCHDLEDLIYEALRRQREKARDDEAGQERYED